MNPRQLRNDICNWLQQILEKSWPSQCGERIWACSTKPWLLWSSEDLIQNVSWDGYDSESVLLYYPQKLIPILLSNPSIEPPPSKQVLLGWCLRKPRQSWTHPQSELHGKLQWRVPPQLGRHIIIHHPRHHACCKHIVTHPNIYTHISK